MLLRRKSYFDAYVFLMIAVALSSFLASIFVDISLISLIAINAPLHLVYFHWRCEKCGLHLLGPNNIKWYVWKDHHCPRCEHDMRETLPFVYLKTVKRKKR